MCLGALGDLTQPAPPSGLHLEIPNPHPHLSALHVKLAEAAAISVQLAMGKWV